MEDLKRDLTYYQEKDDVVMIEKKEFLLDKEERKLKDLLMKEKNSRP